MILVDTSIWIDHLHRPEPRLVELLDVDLIACHPLVIEELALGSLPRRDVILGLLENLHGLLDLDHAETMALAADPRTRGRGVGVVDIRLLGSTLVSPSTRLWTRDRRLRAVADDFGVLYTE